MDVQELLRQAAEVLRQATESFSETLTDVSNSKVEAFREYFDATPQKKSNAACNLFLFHVKVPKDKQEIRYVDVSLNLGEYNYRHIVSKSIEHSLEKFPNLKVVFVTEENFSLPYKSNRLTVVRMPLNSSEPLYERVYAMTAYVRSQMFDCPTVFLDTDAFVGRDPLPLFQNEFDIGVTVRDQPPQLPINEGVIYVNRLSVAAARKFFDAYLATYERLLLNDFVISRYGNIRRWRGGQLSLNGTVRGYDAKGAETNTKDSSPRILVLPCKTFNFSFDEQRRYSKEELATKVVFHLKGPNKALVDYLVNYLASRPPNANPVTLA